MRSDRCLGGLLISMVLLGGCGAPEAGTISQASTQVTNVFAVGDRPTAVAFNPVTNEVVVANGGSSSTVTFVHLADRSIHTVSLGNGLDLNAIAVLGNGGVWVSSRTGL